MFHMFGSMNMLTHGTGASWAYTWERKNIETLHWHGGGERKKSWPLLLSGILCPSQPRGVGGFFFTLPSSSIGLPLAILRQDCVDSGVRAGWHGNCYYCYSAINSDRLAGWRQISERKRDKRLFHVATNSWFWNETLPSFSPPQVEAETQKSILRVLGKELEYIKSDLFFFFSNPPMRP